MPTVATIDAHLDLNTGQFTGAINSAGVALRTFNTNINKTSHQVEGFGGSLLSTVVVLGQLRAALHTVWAFTGQWVASIIEANSKLEKMQILMRGLSGAATEAGKTTDALRDMNYVLDKAKNAPFSIDEISNAFIKLKAAGIDPTKGGLDALMDSISKFGGDDQTFHRATVAIQQMAGKGVISMEELRQQLGEAVPNAMNLLARATKMSMAELVKVISTGRLEAKSALAKLFIEMQFDSQGASERLMNTWGGMISRLKTEWLLFAKEIGNTGLFAAAKASLQDLISFMQSSEGKSFAADLGHGLADVIKLVSSLVSFIVANRSTIISFGKLIAIAFAAKWVAGFSTALLGLVGSFLQIGNALAAFSAKMALQVAAATQAGGAVAGFGARISALAGPIGIAIGLIGALTFHVMENARESRAAAQAWDDYGKAIKNGYVTEDQVDRAKELAKLRQETIDVLAKIDSGEINRFSTETTDLMDKLVHAGFEEMDPMGTFFEQRIQMLRNVRPRLANAMKDVRAGIKLLDNQNAQAEVDGYIDKVTKTITKRIPDIGDALTKINTAVTNGTKTEVQGNAESEALRLQYVARTIQEWTLERDNMKKLVESTPTTNANYETYVQKQKLANEQLLQVQEQRKAILAPNKLVTGAGNSAAEKAAAKQRDALLDYYDSLKAKIAGLKAAAADGNPELAKFEEILAGERKFGRSPNNSVVSKIQKALTELKAVKEEAKNTQMLDKVNQQLDDMAAAAKSDILTNSLKIAASDFEGLAGGVLSFSRNIAIMRLDVIKANGDLAKFDEQAKKIASDLAKVDLQNFEKATKDSAWNTYLDSLPTKARNQAIFNKKLAEYARLRAQLIAADPGNANAIDAAIEERKKADLAQFNLDNRSGLQTWIDEWKDTTDEMDQLWNSSMDNMVNTLTDAVMSGKASFRDLATGILKEITRILISKAVAALANMIINLFGSSSSSGGGDTSGGSAWMAKGGIVGPQGKIPVHAYSSGGIAKTPQMAIFGEGRSPEAYVPLPDGKNIPVRMEGGGAGTNIPISIAVSIDSNGKDQSDTSSETEHGRALGRELTGKIKEVMIQEMRPGGIIWKMKGS